jgi:hypothetical protein
VSELVFDRVSHTYWANGIVVPSVTQILRPVSGYEGMPESMLKEAGERGNRIHAATELDDQGNLDESSVLPEDLPYLEAWRAFKQATGVAILDSELMVFNAVHRYAGTLDRIVGFPDGTEWLVDIKSSTEVKPAVGPQTEAYRQAVGLPKLRRGVVHLQPGKYRFRELTNGRDWSVFQACLLVHRFNQETTNV